VKRGVDAGVVEARIMAGVTGRCGQPGKDRGSFLDNAVHRALSAPAVIVVTMTAAGQPHPIPAIPPLPEGAGPPAIRAALLAEERADFDQAYRRALAEAAETLELAGVLDTLEHWRRRAIMSADPQAYRRMLRRAAHLLSGEDVPEDEPLAQLKERLAQLGV
jgi:Family of unknown function (DUF6247)